MKEIIVNASILSQYLSWIHYILCIRYYNIIRSFTAIISLSLIISVKIGISTSYLWKLRIRNYAVLFTVIPYIIVVHFCLYFYYLSILGVVFLLSMKSDFIEVMVKKHKFCLLALTFTKVKKK